MLWKPSLTSRFSRQAGAFVAPAQDLLRAQSAIQQIFHARHSGETKPEDLCVI
jgi:hypothetical protein